MAAVGPLLASRRSRQRSASPECPLGAAARACRRRVPYPRDVPLSTQVIIHLDKFIDCPYYLTNRSIVVTNEKKAVELTLFSGDLRKYGLTKAITRQQKS